MKYCIIQYYDLHDPILLVRLYKLPAAIAVMYSVTKANAHYNMTPVIID